MKVAIIGFGYWGKIIYKNLKNIDSITEIKICDPLLSEQNVEGVNVKIDSKYYDYDVDCVFIVTPASSHREIVEYFLNNNTHVFCEKPLCLNLDDVKYLYNLSQKRNKILFVDWIFTFNNHINLVKEYYTDGKFGNIKSIEMNRLNFGPVRSDVNACWDLASHDVSIIQYIFEDEFPENVDWINYKRDNFGNQNDTCIGVLKYKTFDCIINASWIFGGKFRKCVFEFDKGFLVWDDKKGKMLFNQKEFFPNQITSPLQNSLEQFFNYCNTGYMVSYNQKKLTEDITIICSNEN